MRRPVLISLLVFAATAVALGAGFLALVGSVASDEPRNCDGVTLEAGRWQRSPPSDRSVYGGDLLFCRVLIGVSQDGLVAALGRPDETDSTRWSYFNDPRIGGSYGGFFLYFDTAGRVSDQRGF